MKTVAVCIPSLAERDAYLWRTTGAFNRERSETISIACFNAFGLTWGGGCNWLFDHFASGFRYVLFGCDDAVPRPGCVEAAVRYHFTTGHIPGCRFYQDGEPMDESYDARPHGETTPWTRLFLLTPAIYQRVGPLLDLTWYTDIDYCQRLNEHGYTISMCDGFAFDHLDPPRTWAADGEVERQHRVYREACAAAGRSPLA